MKVNWTDRLGDLNPPVIARIQRRLKPRNVLIAVGISLLGQLLLLMSFSTMLPLDSGNADITTDIAEEDLGIPNAYGCPWQY
jgi:hypothetical protein